jgi:hypothetical protein
MPSKIPAISTRVGRLMRLIEGSQCIAGEESGVELELREALEKPLCTAIRKIQKQKYTSALATKIAIVVTDQGKEFDFGMMVGNALTTDPASEYGRGIHWINAFMDDVYFEPRVESPFAKAFDHRQRVRARSRVQHASRRRI